MNERGCYCALWEKNPAHLESQGIPRGYCGLCDKCGRPGHTRQFPGAVPYTGSWCHSHYRLLSFVHPFGTFGILLYSAGLVTVGMALWYYLRG